MGMIWQVEVTNEHYKRERTPAWRKCANCGGDEWHEAVTVLFSITGEAEPYVRFPYCDYPVTKSTILTRLREVCPKCGGNRFGGWSKDSGPIACKHCDGTGIDPDASVPPWEVEGRLRDRV